MTPIQAFKKLNENLVFDNLKDKRNLKNQNLIKEI